MSVASGRRSVADLLRAVSSAEELHDALCQIASSSEGRWKRTQILHYLPERFHSIAKEYFEGEHLVIPERRPVDFDVPDVIALDEALGETPAETWANRGEEAAKERKQPPPLEKLSATARDANDVIGNVLVALLEEARAVDREMPKRYRLKGGRCVGARGDSYAYLFNWSSDPDLHVPGELRAGEHVAMARVVRQGEGEKQFELLVDSFVGMEIDSAIFRIDPTFLHRTAFQRLQTLQDVFESNAPLAQALFRRPDEHVALPTKRYAAEGTNAAQRLAVDTVASAERTYVWGPPGTGKTTSLGHLIRHLKDRGERTLILSAYNPAVDEAVLAAHRRGEWRDEEIVRFGRISLEVKRAGIDLESLLEKRAAASGLLERVRRLHAAVFAEFKVEQRPTPGTVNGCLEDLGAVAMELGRRLQKEQPKKLQLALRAMRDEFRAPEVSILGNARVIGTTVTLSFLSTHLAEQGFDQILVDEASVLRVPEALIVALKKPKRLSFFGDPKQLPSIVKVKSAHADRWLRRNPFELAGIERPSDAKGACVILTQQHRMAPPIRAAVSKHFYDGVLEDGHCPPVGDLIFLDTSATNARTTTRWIRMSPSKENLVHRGVVSALMRELRKREPHSKILVLSPYKGQQRAYDSEANTNRVDNARFQTVHRSQGTESDTVIIDLVLAPGRGKSRFMNERITPAFRNLMNVAMSRAKTRLVLVGHYDYIASAYPGGLLQMLLDYARATARSRTVPADLRLQRFMQQAME